MLEAVAACELELEFRDGCYNFHDCLDAKLVGSDPS